MNQFQNIVAVWLLYRCIVAGLAPIQCLLRTQLLLPVILVYFNNIMTVSPYLWSLSLPLVVRVGVQYGGGHTDWLYSGGWLTTDENQKKNVYVYMNMVAIKSPLYTHTFPVTVYRECWNEE